MFGSIFAGAGLGLLVGILVGLSSSPVVATVVSALAAGMVTLLGFTRQKTVPADDGDDGKKEESVAGLPASRDSALRLGSFGVACAAAVISALFLRTHNWASPTIAEQVAEVQRAGYSAEEARKWVAYRNIGPVLYAPASAAHGEGAGEKGSPAAGPGASAAQSVLFSGGNEGQCQYFDTTRYSSPQEQIFALRQMGGKYAEYADKLATLDAARQKTVLESLRLLFCPL